MKELLNNLLKLQAIQFQEPPGKPAMAEVEALRVLVPSQVLAHYDRLVSRGKKGVALVKNQVCTGCHMRLPIGTINTLMQGTDLRLCEMCGRYLLLVPQTEEVPAVAVAVAPARKVKGVKIPKHPGKRKVAGKAEDKAVENAD
ncbi:MAG: C4-type zinc ribbon domain-containing protein [Verrucomicrobiota bacterium]|jgi:hypothetical protein|nr:C4-type zinc ribbon domain-containing protein [Verrucomicrobiota bacterium]